MKHLLILASTVTRFISICAFAPSSVFLSVLQASIKICLITAILLAKTKLNTLEEVYKSLNF